MPDIERDADTERAEGGKECGRLVAVRHRSLPERLRYHAERLIDAADRYAVSEVTSHAIALTILAGELERTEIEVEDAAYWQAKYGAHMETCAIVAQVERYDGHTEEGQ